MPHFKYSLKNVLAVRKLSHDAVLAEQINAFRIAKDKALKTVNLEKIATDIEQQMRSNMTVGSTLDQSRQEIRNRYLADVNQRLGVAKAEQAQAQLLHEQAQFRVQVEAQRVCAFERHQERKLKQFSKTQASVTQKLQDDLWLARIANRSDS